MSQLIWWKSSSWNEWLLVDCWHFNMERHMCRVDKLASAVGRIGLVDRRILIGWMAWQILNIVVNRVNLRTTFVHQKLKLSTKNPGLSTKNPGDSEQYVHRRRLDRLVTRRRERADLRPLCPFPDDCELVTGSPKSGGVCVALRTRGRSRNIHRVWVTRVRTAPAGRTVMK